MTVGQPPILPDSFYGSLTVNAGPAPAGVTLVAKIAGVERGRHVTEQAGRYGYSGAGQPKLLVEGISDDIGKEIHFYLKNYDGKLLEAFEATSADGKLTVTIPKDTIAKDKNGNRLTGLTSAVDPSPPSLPNG